MHRIPSKIGRSEYRQRRTHGALDVDPRPRGVQQGLDAAAPRPQRSTLALEHRQGRRVPEFVRGPRQRGTALGLREQIVRDEARGARRGNGPIDRRPDLLAQVLEPMIQKASLRRSRRHRH